jgi:hypothetical protein
VNFIVQYLPNYFGKTVRDGPNRRINQLAGVYCEPVLSKLPLAASSLDLPSDRRAAFLAESCAGDEDLRADVERLVETSNGYSSCAYSVNPGYGGIFSRHELSWKSEIAERRGLTLARSEHPP